MQAIDLRKVLFLSYAYESGADQLKTLTNGSRLAMTLRTLATPQLTSCRRKISGIWKWPGSGMVPASGR